MKNVHLLYFNQFLLFKGNPLEEEFNKLLASVDPVPSKLVKPTPGKHFYYLETYIRFH